MADEDEYTIVVAKRKIRWEPAEVPVPTLEEFQASLPTIDAQPDFITESELDGSQVLIESKRMYKKRIGNGHKSVKVRDLLESERTSIRKLFLIRDGQIEDDDCVGFKEQSKWDDVGIFQITGFVSVLHTDVASGLLQLKDLIAYENWMSTKYGGTLWARYNLPLYVKTRAINTTLISQGQSPVKAKKVKKIKADNPKAVPIVNTQGDVVGVQGISTTPKFTSFRKKWAGA